MGLFALYLVHCLVVPEIIPFIEYLFLLGQLAPHHPVCHLPGGPVHHQCLLPTQFRLLYLFSLQLLFQAFLEVLHHLLEFGEGPHLQIDILACISQ